MKNKENKPENWLEYSLIQLRELDLKERAIQVQILEILLEIERRKAYSQLGYDGLFSFCVKELGYSESQAYQRIQAMHAMKVVPQIKEKIQTGAMNVTTVAQVQVMIRQDRVNEGVQRSPQEKLELFESFEGKTSKQVKEQIAEVRGEKIKLKLHLELDEEAEELWKEVKARAAHRTQGSGLMCFKMLMKEWLKRKAENSNPNPRRSISGLTGKNTKFIPIQTRREILARDQHQCQNCGSKHAVQLDHIRPKSRNGENAFQNLRTLCRNCNLYFGIKEFGFVAMKR